MRQLSIRLNKTGVTLTYRGDGIVAFQVPALPEGATVRLWFRKHEAGNARSSLFAGRGAVFRDMIRNAFLKNGGLTLNGYLAPVTDDDDSPAFRTVIQPDADILCQIDQRVLEREDYQQLLCGYDRVRHLFLEAFRNRIRFLVLQIIGISGGCLSLWGIVELFSSAFG